MSNGIGHGLPAAPLTGQEEVSTQEDFERGGRPPLDYRPLLKPVLQYELYNPSDKSMQFTKAGVDFYLPARDKRWRGKDPGSGQPITYPKPGVLPIWGIPDQKISALDVIKFAVGADGVSGTVGVNGVRALFGDERDEQVMEDARAGWVRKNILDWTLTTQNHERAVRKAKEDGEPPPPVPRPVKEAYEGLMRYGAESEDYLQIKCETCNWGFPTEKAMWEHVLGMHRDRTAEANAALGLDGRSAKVVTGLKPYEAPEDKGKLPTAEEIEDALAEAAGEKQGKSKK